VIEQLRGSYSDRLLCEALDVHRSSLYHEPRPDEDRPLWKALSELAGRWPTYGYRRLTVMLRREGHTVNAKRVRRLMSELGLSGEPPPRHPRTTDSVHGFPRVPNRVESLEVVRPDQVWVSDITHIRLKVEFISLAVLMDVFSRSIRGWNLGRSREQELTLVALRRAMERGTPEIHHSDQGGAGCGDRRRRGADGRRDVDQHGGRGRAGGERVRRAADADEQRRGGGPDGIRGLRRCLEAARPVPGRGVQPEADSLIPGVLDAERVRATMDRHAAIGMIGRSNRHHKMVVRFQGRTSVSGRSLVSGTEIQCSVSAQVAHRVS
jgi:transposase InsO family protein